MKHGRIVFLALALAANAEAHFTTVVPRAASLARGQAAVVDVFWGHPYEHVVFPAPPPERIEVLAPSGKRIAAKAEGDGARYRVSFTPEERGDHLLLLQSPVHVLADEGEAIRDYAKVVLRGATQEGWDRPAGEKLEIVPLTRPYGLEAGFVFQGQVLHEGKPLPGAPVEIERYHEKPPRAEDLPDEAMATRAARTDPNGVLTFTLDEPGWWVLAASRPAGTAPRDGKDLPLAERALLWVYVGPPFTQRIR